jgi:hypothetical protein
MRTVASRLSGNASGRPRTRDAATLADGLRRCLPVWLATRLLVVGAGTGIALAFGKSLTNPWTGWDAGWFLHIARHGYTWSSGRAESPAFYPLYPAVLAVTGAVLGGNPVLAGVLLAFPITLGVFVLMYVVADRLLGEADSASRAVAYFAVFPYAFFLQALYSEGIFLVCAIAAFIVAERRMFLAAGALSGGAMLARPVGIAVLVGVAILALGSHPRSAALARLSVALLLFGAFPALLALQGRSPVAFLTVEHGWRAYSVRDPLGAAGAPFEQLVDGARAAWRAAGHLVSGESGAYTLHDVTAFPIAVLFIALSVVAWRKLGPAYGAYCAVAMAVPLVTRPLDTPLLSFQRFAIVLFPCFIVLGSLRFGRLGHWAILAGSAAAMVTLLYFRVRGGYFIT